MVPLGPAHFGDRPTMHSDPLFDEPVKPTKVDTLAIDAATMSGWAFRMNGLVHSGTYNCQHDVKRESPGMRFLRFTTWLTTTIKDLTPVRVVYEQSHQRGGAATTVSVGLTTHIMSTCAALGVEHESVHSRELKKWLTGKGNASKEEMIAKVNESTGLQITDDNEADAIALLLYSER